MKIRQTLEGGGKYDKECEDAFRACEAQGVLLIVHSGNRGHGFSAILTPDLFETIPDLLRRVADDIEQQRKAAFKQ